MQEYKPRVADKILKWKTESKGAVLIEGPKWCGKTTTAAQIAKTVIKMDDPLNRDQYMQMARINPLRLFSGPTPILIDEWQVEPKLWDAIRFEVDKRGGFGHFILTGSAVPADTSEIKHTGTGRFTWLKMRPMSLFESGESNGNVSLSSLFKGPEVIEGESYIDLEQLAFLTCRGGWPEAIDISERAALQQSYDYLDAVVHSDINRADGYAKNPDRVIRLMKSYARNQGGQVSNTILAADVKGNDSRAFIDETAADYINALKQIFVVEDIPAWNPNIRSKTAIRSSDTRYFVDPSIATAALAIGPEDLLSDLRTFGFLFETLCVRDLRVFADALDGNVYHYRDKSGLECDAVVHLRNGCYGLIEIKLGGEELIESGASSLKTLSSKIDTDKMKTPSFLMVLTGIGKYAYRREDGVYVVPIGCLGA